MNTSSVVEALGNVMKTLVDDEPKPPLHVGEVMLCWTYLALVEESLAFLQIGLNTTVDPELTDALQRSYEQCLAQATRFREFMTNEGVPLPASPEIKPKSDPHAVPVGVKLTDDEIANGVSLKSASAILMCGHGITQTIRVDLGMIWLESQLEKITFATNLRTLMRKRGWMKYPPAYLPPGVPLHGKDY